MKDRAEDLIKELGCETDDLGLVLWNTPPGAIVLIERLLVRVKALEELVEVMTSRQKAPAARTIEKADVPAGA